MKNKSDSNKKNIKTYVILAFCLGFVGAHKFYIGKNIYATIMLVLSLLSCLTGEWFLFQGALMWALIDGIIGLNNFSTPKKIFQQTKEEKEKNQKYNEFIKNSFAKIVAEAPDFFKSLPASILSFLIECFIGVYLIITFGFPFFFNCPSGGASCKCLVSSVNKNMSFSDKITFIVNGANREDLIPYLDFGDAIKCSMIPD